MTVSTVHACLQLQQSPERRKSGLWNSLAGNEIRLVPCLYAPFVRLYMYPRSDRESVQAAESAYVEQSR